MIHIPGGDMLYWQDQKKHTLAPFWIDRTEVTVAALRKYVEAGARAAEGVASPCRREALQP